MCECSPQFQPNEKLKRQLKLVLILMIIGAIPGIGFFFLKLSNLGISVLIALLFLFCGYQSLLYYYLSLYIFLTLFTTFMLFILFGIVLQQEFLGAESPLKDTVDYVQFGFVIFTFLYNIFSIIFIFPIYKEMRAQLFEVVLSGRLGAGGDMENQNGSQERQIPIMNNQQNNPPESQSNNRGGFTAFTGRGTAVGGG
jgi:hypothetical protein